MTWIRVDLLMPNHPKLVPLAEALDITRSHAVGLLVSVWTYAAMYHPDGDLTKVSNAHLGHYLGNFDAVSLQRAMRATGWLDADGRLHDWEDYQAIEIARREKNRNYMREYRLRDKAATSDPPEDLRKPLRNGLRKGATYVRTNEQTTAQSNGARSRAGGRRGLRAARASGKPEPVPDPARVTPDPKPIAETMADLRSLLRPTPSTPEGLPDARDPEPES